MTIKNKKELSSSIEQLEKAINQQETILQKFDNSLSYNKIIMERKMYFFVKIADTKKINGWASVLCVNSGTHLWRKLYP